MHFARVLTVAFSIVAAQSYIFNVTVEPGSFNRLDYYIMDLTRDDAVQFEAKPNTKFLPLFESTYDSPCIPKPQGFVYKTSGAYVVTNPDVPVWMFQDGHCGRGYSIVFAINPKNISQFDAFKEKARQSNVSLPS